jgi:hypothetical protein
VAPRSTRPHWSGTSSCKYCTPEDAAAILRRLQCCRAAISGSRRTKRDGSRIVAVGVGTVLWYGRRPGAFCCRLGGGGGWLTGCLGRAASGQFY